MPGISWITVSPCLMPGLHSHSFPYTQKKASAALPKDQHLFLALARAPPSPSLFPSVYLYLASGFFARAPRPATPPGFLSRPLTLDSLASCTHIYSLIPFVQHNPLPVSRPTLKFSLHPSPLTCLGCLRSSTVTWGLSSDILTHTQNPEAHLPCSLCSFRTPSVDPFRVSSLLPPHSVGE